MLKKVLEDFCNQLHSTRKMVCIKCFKLSFPLCHYMIEMLSSQAKDWWLDMARLKSRIKREAKSQQRNTRARTAISVCFVLVERQSKVRRTKIVDHSKRGQAKKRYGYSVVMSQNMFLTLPLVEIYSNKSCQAEHKAYKLNPQTF